jgi:hypothetical protein
MTTANSVDLAWLWSFITTIAAAVLGVLMNKANAELAAHTGLAANSALLNNFTKLVGVAGQAALDELSSIASHNMTVEVKSTAVANGIKTAGDRLQTAADALGYTPAVVASVVSGEVAKAMMPTATVAPAATPTPMKTP